MKLALAELSLVLLVGVSRSGKSTFTRRHFKPTKDLIHRHGCISVSLYENDRNVGQRCV